MFRRKLKTVIAGCLLASGIFVAACTDSETAKRQAFESGNRFFDQKQYPQAIIEYRNAIRQDGLYGDARYKLAQALELSGNFRGARSEYVRAADLLPDNADAQLAATRHLLSARRFEDARTRIEGFLKKNPNSVEGQIFLGNALLGLRDLAGAIAEVEEAIAIDPQRGTSYSSLGTLRLAQGERDQARAAYEKAVQVDPKSIDAWLALATFHWAVGESTQAERSLQSALAIDERHTETNRALAAYYVSANRATEAERHLKRVADTTGTAEARVALADYYLRFNRPNDASVLLKDLLNDKRSYAAAQARLAFIEYGAGQTAHAHAMLDEILKRDPDNVETLLMKARWLTVEGRRPDALERVKVALAANPVSVPALYLLGTLEAAARDLEGATKTFSEVMRLNPRVVGAQVQLSELALVGGDAAKAAELANNAVVIAPNARDARVVLVRALLARRDFKRAQSEVAGLLKQAPNAAVAHALAGSLKSATNDMPGARVSFEHALQLDPQSIEALTGVLTLDIAEKRTAQARALVDKQLAGQPKDIGLLVLAGRVYAAVGDPVAAERSLRTAISLEPGAYPAYLLLGQLFISTHRLDAARKEFLEYSQKNPKDIGALTMVAMIYEVQKNVPEATKMYEQVLSMSPRAAVASNNLAMIYADAGDNLDRALTLALAAAQQMPENSAVQDTLGWVYYRQNLPNLAIPPFERSVARSPDGAAYHYHLAMAYMKAGELVKARRSAEAVIRLNPQHAEAQKLLHSLQG